MFKIKLNKIIFTIIIFTLFFTLTAWSWTGPTQAPPNGNVSPPIDQSSTTQYKEGALGIGGVFETDVDTHLGISGGDVGIGTTSPEYKIDVNGDINTNSMLRIEGEGIDNRFWNFSGWDGDNTSSSWASDFILTRDDPYDAGFMKIGTDELSVPGWGPHFNENHNFYIMTTNWTPLITVEGGGSVGIGTTSPSSRLEVNGSIRADEFNGVVGYLGRDATSDERVYSEAPSGVSTINKYDGSQLGNFYTYLTAKEGATTTGLQIAADWNSNGSTTPDSLHWRVKDDNTAEWTNWRQIASKEYVDGTTSDIRLKERITSIHNPVNKIKKLNAFTFNWINRKKYGKSREIGFSAQQVENIFPEVVFTKSDGYKAIDYSQLIPILVEGIKEQQNKINKLQKEQRKILKRLEDD